MNEFEKSIKTAFRGEKDQDFFVNFPMAGLADDIENNIVSNCWNMECADAESIFRPIIAAIVDLVTNQVNLITLKQQANSTIATKGVRAIFLVGGFGSSEYPKQSIQRAHPDIEVIQPNDAWSAVVKRAVLSQLPGEAVITSTGARKHYGVASKQPYDERRDAAQPRIWDKYQEIWRTVKQKYRPKDLIFTSNLIESTIEAAPVYPGEGFTTRNCSLVADLSSLGKSHLRKRRSPGGRVYYEVEYNLVVTMETTLMKFSLEIDGEEMRSVQATYE